MVHINSIPHPSRRNPRSQRRLRPGMHERRSMNRKEGVSFDLEDGLSVARDASIVLPFESAKPSPLRRQTFDQSWERWKAREAAQAGEEKQERLALESEQVRLFGGSVGDDELRNLGIVYDSDEEPEYTVRYVPARHRRRRIAIQLHLPLFQSLLSENLEIARLMAASIHVPDSAISHPTIQHRDLSSLGSDFPTANTPTQSLPPSEFEFNPSGSASPISVSFPSPISHPFDDSTWEVLSRSHTPLHTPTSEPETWILLSTTDS